MAQRRASAHDRPGLRWGEKHVKTNAAWGFLESPALESGARRALTGDECVVGSAPGSYILVNHPTVSRRHAVLRRIAGRC